MPLHEVSAADAFARIGGNPAARWPRRGAGNRLDPVCQPHLAPRFTFEAGQSFFAIGSCFARNIEDYLLRRALRVITREKSFAHYHTKDRTTENVMLIKYTPGAIEYELATALGVQAPLPDERYILNDGQGNWYDINLSIGSALRSREAAIARRAEVRGVFSRLGEADVLFLTLGLVEEWHDVELGIVMCGAPSPALADTHPGRFVCRIMTYDEALNSVRRILALARAANPRIKSIVTVSPVPLARTFGRQDVIVANCYSKSMLRAVAQTVTMELPDVDYFPSYEMVMLSAGQASWNDDLRHVRDAMVGDVMTAFHRAYFPDAAAVEQPSAVYITACKHLVAKNYAGAYELLESIKDEFAGDERFHVNHLKSAQRSGKHARAVALARQGVNGFRQVPRYAMWLYENAFELGWYDQAREAVALLRAHGATKSQVAALGLRLALVTDNDELHRRACDELMEAVAAGEKLSALRPPMRQLAEAAVAGLLLGQRNETVPV